MRLRFAQLTQNHNQIGYAWYPRRAFASFPVERSSELTLWRHRVAVRFFANNFCRVKDGYSLTVVHTTPHYFALQDSPPPED